ncbi:metallopeptidase MepB [Metarhizium brunneum]
MYAAPDAETYEAIRKGFKIFKDAFAGLMASRRLFLLFEAAAKKDEALDEESRHLVQDRLQDFSVDYLHRFLAGLGEALVPLGQEEIPQLQELRIRDGKARNICVNGDADLFPPWDTLYYKAKALKDSGVDDAAVAEYFPLQHTVTAMLHLFEEFLHLKFTQIPPEELAHDKIWHETVSAWESREASTNDFLGYLYFDLLMRE